tara:strand:+ start:874 stop:1317 length:444 start_codon:yes stop_codon:yes gene_type:complete
MNKIDAIQNRNDVYYKIIDKLPKKRATIYQMILEHQPCTPQELQDKYYIPANEVSPRFTELREAGYIVADGFKNSRRSKHKNICYRITTSSERIDIINAKYVELKTTVDYLTNDLNMNRDNDNLSAVTKNMIKKRIKKLENEIQKLN